jgi:hypothetical protein
MAYFKTLRVFNDVLLVERFCKVECFGKMTTNSEYIRF